MKLTPPLVILTLVLQLQQITPKPKSTITTSSVQYHPCKPPHDTYPFCNHSLPISFRTHSLISLLSLSDKVKFLCNNFTGIPSLGIPPYQWWSESLHGLATNGPGVSFLGPSTSATVFPQVINSAASFNSSLWFLLSSSIALEGRAMYNNGQAGLTFWAPNVNIFRDPRWGRGQETPGEDPFVVSSYAVEFVKGFQGEGRNGNYLNVVSGQRRVLEEDDGKGRLMLSACCKHFTAYDLDKWANFTRYTFNAVVNPQDMEDTYEPPFKSCIQKGKASCLMCSYNSVNGVPACARGDLLHKAREEWGFDGYVTSDCDAVATIYEYQKYVNTAEDAVADALKAGVDINCGTYMLKKAASAVAQGKVQEEDIDRALRNQFNILFRLGLFDGDPLKGMYGSLGSQNICTEEHQSLALEAAKQGIVLLKNDNNFLPLNRDIVSTLGIIGPGANSSSQLLGGYSGVPCISKTYIDGMQEYINTTIYAGGCTDVACESTSTFDEALHLAESSDYVILVFGLDLTQETEDKDRVSLLLPGKQMELISSVAAVTKRPLVLVLTGGGPLDVSFAQLDPRIASILWVGYPGEGGGKALAQVVFGDYNPGGKLPMTWYPESFTKIPMDDMSIRADPTRLYPGRTHRFYTGETVYPFGYGLSYTNYTYKILSAPTKLNLLSFTRLGLKKRKPYRREVGLNHIRIDELESCDMLKFNVHICIMNVGDIDGSHVVMLYSKSSREMKGAPVKQLIGFSRVHIRGHGLTDTIITVDPCEHLSYANEYGKRILPLGEHILVLENLEYSLLVEL